jgi:hypothetical protein
MGDGFFWPILERAEAIGAPIYLHPTPPRTIIGTFYAGNYRRRWPKSSPPQPEASTWRSRLTTFASSSRLPQ